MSSTDTPPRQPDERWFTVGALALLWLGALASAWAVLCRQSPASPYLVRGYYEPVEALSLRAWALAVITLVCARLAARGALFTRENAARAWAIFALWSLGAALSCGAMAYSGATGVGGIQLRDSGQRGHGTLVVRWAGGAMLLSSLALAQRFIARSSAKNSDKIDLPPQS